MHKQRLLFNDTYTDRYRRSAANHLTARGVTLHLDDTVEDLPAEAGPATVLTKGGLKLSADLVVSVLYPDRHYVQPAFYVS